jgi:hypothetical protein
MVDANDRNWPRSQRSSISFASDSFKKKIFVQFEVSKSDLQRCRLINIKPPSTEQYMKWVKQNPIITSIPCTSTTRNNSRQGHGRNRGLNTQHVIDGIETRREGRQDNTNGK